MLFIYVFINLKGKGIVFMKMTHDLESGLEIGILFFFSIQRNYFI